MSFKVAVVGATGNVGREILQTLAERKFPAREVVALASSGSVGSEVSYGEDETLPVQSLETFDFAGCDFVFSSLSEDLTRKFAPKVTDAGAVLIDNSAAFRMDSQVPLVVPEVNEHALEAFRNRNIIASPNCIATPLAMVLKPLQEEVELKRAVVSTYQSVSGAGRTAMDELFNQTRDIFMNNPVRKEEFTKQIAFNVIPHIDNFEEDGTTGEERKIIQETQKLLNCNIGVSVTSVRVPVFIGHGFSVNLELEAPLSDKQAREMLREAPGVAVVDHRLDEGYVTPTECVGEDLVYVSRIREDPSVPYGLNFWVVCDNVRKGAALNTVQIGERLAADYL